MQKYTDEKLWSLFLTAQAADAVQAVRANIADSSPLLDFFEGQKKASLIKFATTELLTLGKEALMLAAHTRTAKIDEGTFIEFHPNYNTAPLFLTTDTQTGWRTSEEIELGRAYVYRWKGHLHYIKGNKDTVFTERYDRQEDAIKTKLPGLLLRRNITKFVDGKKIGHEIKYIHLVFRDYRPMTIGQLSALNLGTIVETKEGLLFIKLRGEWFLQIPGDGRAPFETRDVYGHFHVLPGEAEDVWGILWRNYTIKPTYTGNLEVTIQIPSDLEQRIKPYINNEIRDAETFTSDLFSLVQQRNRELSEKARSSSRRLEVGPGFLRVIYPEKKIQDTPEPWYLYGLREPPIKYKSLLSGIARTEPPIPSYDNSTHFGVAVFYSPLTPNEIKRHKLSIYIPSVELIDRICSNFRKQSPADYEAATQRMEREPEAIFGILYKFVPEAPFFSDAPLEEIMEVSHQKLKMRKKT